MKTFFKYIVIILIVIAGISFIILKLNPPKSTLQTNHQLLLESIESIGKLELVKYRFSDVVEHKNVSTYLPDASVLLVVKADAVGCIDLTKVKQEDIFTLGDSVSITLPTPEICYVKIDHNSSKVYDTKMAFFREAKLVDEAYQYAEIEIKREVKKSDIMLQTRNNAMHVLKPLLIGLGFNKVNISFES